MYVYFCHFLTMPHLNGLTMRRKLSAGPTRPRQPTQVKNRLGEDREGYDQRMDDEALTRIIESVGRRYIPDELNREKLDNQITWLANRERLRNDLEQVANWYNTSYTLRQSEGKKRQTLLKILKKASDLHKLLSADDAQMLILNLRSVDYPDDPRISLEWLIEKISHVLKERAETSIEVGTILKSERSLKHIAGERLPSIFEIHFKRKRGASRTKDTGRPGGPCVRFVERAMIEMGMPYQTESIASAMTKLNPDDQHYFRSNTATPKKADCLTGRPVSASEREDIYQSQARSVASLGRSLGYSEDDIEAAIGRSPSKPGMGK
jgi:hypothetical protein